MMMDVIDTQPIQTGDNDINYLQTFYHNLVEAAGNVFFVTDYNGFFVYVNSAVEPVLGYKPSEVIGMHFTELVAPAWQERVSTFYVEQFKHLTPESTLEFVAVAANGEEHWIEQLARLMIVDGRVMGFNGLVHDITRRKRAETERQTLEKSYLMASENSRSTVFAADANGKIIYANPALSEATGYTHDELIGMNALKLVHPDYHKGLIDFFQNCDNWQSHASRSETRIVRKDGSICWLDIVANWGEIAGKPIILGSALDITERKRIEQELQESRFFVEQINKTIPDVVYVFDIEQWKIIYTNRPFPTLLGYSAEELESMSFHNTLELVHPDERETYSQRAELLKSLGDGEIREFTYRIQHKDGRYRWLHLRNTAFERGSDGRVKRVLGLTRDVSTQMEIQEALRQSEENSRKSLQYQRMLNEINIELADLDTVDEICQRAIELGLSRLDFDRLGLLLYDEQTEMIKGTYGTDIEGKLRDERSFAQPMSKFTSWLNESVQGKKRVRVRNNTPLYDDGEVIGRGWNALAILWNGDKVIGWLAADNLTRQEPLQDYQLELLDSYASALEHLYVRKHTEEALRESNRRYDQLVANMLGMVYRIRRDGENQPYYEYLSPRCKDVTGLESEAVLANANLILDQIVPEDRVKYDALVRTNLEEPQVFRWEGAVVINGERRWRRVESRPYQLADGSIVWDGIMTDITESKRAEEALRQSEERYRTMVEEHSEMISRYTPDTKLTFVNESVCRYFGQPREYFIGHSILDFSPQEYHAPTLQRIEQAISTGKPFQYEHPIMMSNGSLRWFEWTDTPIFGSNGEVVNFQSVGRDIDIRKRTEAERNDYINRLEIIRRVDMELTESLNIEHVLQIALDAAVRISQASAGAIHILENSMLRVVHVVGNFPASMVGSSLPLTKGIVGRVARRAVPELITDVNLDPDYLPNVVETRAQMTLPLVSQDRLIGVINVQTSHSGVFTRPMFDFLKVLTVRIASALDNARLHSATEKHLTEITDLYQQVTELEQLKTQMIRIAAHDLRNPLGVISGYVQMLADEMAEHMTDRTRDQIMTIKDSINRIDKITRDILTLERIAAGREMASDHVDLTQMICDVFNQIKPQAALKRQSYELDKPEATFYVKADRFLLPETIVNLLTNAVKYTPEEGEIRVHLEQKGDRALFSVKDNGYGIPTDQQENLFQPFFRVKSKETRGISGTGLGLHLVKSIIEKHHGEMRFHSEYKKGSTFGFELPLEEVSLSPSKRKGSTG